MSSSLVSSDGGSFATSNTDSFFASNSNAAPSGNPAGAHEESSSGEEESDDDGSSLAQSLSTTDAIELSDGQLQGADKLINLSEQIPELAIATLSLSNNNLVDPAEVQKYNDDSYCNRGILKFAAALSTHRSITSLDLSMNNLGVKGQSGLVAVANAAKNGVLKTLDLSANQILGPKNVRYDGLKALAKAIETSSGGDIQELHLSQNHLHASAICFLGISLTNTTLTHLDLSENSIGIDSLDRRSSTGMNSIVMALASNLCKLETLNLSDNHLGNEECIMLAGVLETMFELKVLDLSFNDIHAVGARHLGEALKFNETLEYLDLGANHIQDGGCGDLAEALKSNEALETLIIANNDLTTSSCYYWIDCLQQNRKLVELNIEDNANMEEFDRKEVMEWVKGNSELIVMREDPAHFDLAVKTKIVRDNLLIKVSREDKEAVISHLVTNISIKNDPDFYERVSTICPPDRRAMLRMTQNLLSLMGMTKEDKAVRMLQKCIRRQQERKLKEAELKEKEKWRRNMAKSASKMSFNQGSAKKLVRAGNANKAGKAHVGTKAGENIVVR